LSEITKEKCFQLILYNRFVLWLDDRETAGGTGNSLFFLERISQPPRTETKEDIL
jgi:hypothetical protein